MKRHPFDPISFVAGAVFLLIAGAAATDANYDLDVGAWLLPVAALILGIGILAASLRTLRKPDGIGDESDNPIIRQSDNLPD